MLVVVGIRRALDLRQRVIFQLLHDDFNRLFQLCVFPLAPSGRIEINFNIRRDAVVLNFPITVQAVDCCAGCGHASAID